MGTATELQEQEPFIDRCLSWGTTSALGGDDHELRHPRETLLALERRLIWTERLSIRMHNLGVEYEKVQITTLINHSSRANLVHLMTTLRTWINPKALGWRPEGNNFVRVGNVSSSAREWIADACVQRIILCGQRLNKLRGEKGALHFSKIDVKSIRDRHLQQCRAHISKFWRDYKPQVVSSSTDVWILFEQHSRFYSINITLD